VLARVGPRPIGWVRFPRAMVGDYITPDAFHALAAEQVGLQLHDALRHRTHERPPVPHTPSISVVVCTREHPDLLERQLESLAKLEYPDYDVIVVDNAPKTTRTWQVCQKFQFVRYVMEPRKGLDYARNTGWRVSTKQVIAYTDDDACVDRYWLQGLGQNYADPHVKCVTGTTFPMELESVAQEHFEKYGGMQRGFQRRVYKPGTWNTFYPLGSGRFGAGVNLSLRREWLEQMGGFDEALDVGSVARGCGDLDIMARTLRDGGWLVYDPAAVVWHQHRRTMRELRRQMFDYGWGFCAYCTKHSRDLELGNLSYKMLKRWSGIWAKKRMKQNFSLAIRMRHHFPLHLIAIEILGGILGLRAYDRSVKKTRSDAVRYAGYEARGDATWQGFRQHDARPGTEQGAAA
jgi:cellulose synthase/poly-beta-1,6-N-acetylglucosamine synthase-like glycosyltransferase